MSDLKFTSTHEWLKKEQDMVVIGITKHAEQLLGDMVFVELPELGDTVQVGDELGVVESVKAASDFYAPISGVVTAINEAVVADPAMVNRDPYNAGWLVKLQPSNPEEIHALLDAAQYDKVIAEEN